MRTFKHAEFCATHCREKILSLPHQLFMKTECTHSPANPLSNRMQSMHYCGSMALHVIQATCKWLSVRCNTTSSNRVKLHFQNYMFRHFSYCSCPMPYRFSGTLECYGSHWIFPASLDLLGCVINKDYVISWREIELASKVDIPNIFWSLKVFVNSTHCTVCWATLCVATRNAGYSSANIDVKVKVFYWSSNFVATWNK